MTDGMTPARHRECVDLPSDLARILRCSDRLTHRWASGKIAVPVGIAVGWRRGSRLGRRIPIRPRRMIGTEQPERGGVLLLLDRTGGARSVPYSSFDNFLRKVPVAIRCSLSILTLARVLSLMLPVAKISFIGVQ